MTNDDELKNLQQGVVFIRLLRSLKAYHASSIGGGSKP